MEAMDRFLNKIEVTDSGCWNWIGSHNDNGYAYFSYHGRTVGAHKWIYEQINGPVPDEKELDHTCRNRGCVNPEHLEPLTPQQNTLRGDTIAARNASVTHCPNGHAYDELNTIQYRNKRYCKECSRIRSRDYKRRVRLAKKSIT